MSTDHLDDLDAATPDVIFDLLKEAGDILAHQAPVAEWNPLESARTLFAYNADTQQKMLGEILVRGSRTVVMGDSGHGKSTMALSMMKAVATNGLFLNYYQCESPGPVLCIDTEQGIRSIQKKIDHAGLQHCDNLFFLRVPDGLDLPHNREQVDRIEKILADGPPPTLDKDGNVVKDHGDEWALVTVDSLYKAFTGDSSDERVAVEFMRLWDEWRSRFGFAFLCQMHIRKPLEAGKILTMADAFGSSAWTRMPEVVLGLQRIDGDSPRAKLYFFKDRDGELPVGHHWILSFDKHKGEFSIVTQSEKRASKDGSGTTIWKALRDNGAMTVTEIVEACELTDKTVMHHLATLTEQGRVRQSDTIRSHKGGRASRLWQAIMEGDDVTNWNQGV